VAHFDGFIRAFAQDDVKQTINAELLAREINDTFEVDVPPVVLEWLSEVGSGYFANREFFVFPDSTASTGRTLIQWNSADFWRRILPPPKDGGPIVFAENCFGNQLGFRWDQGRAIGYLLDVDTFEAFTVAETLTELFGNVLTDRYAFTNAELLTVVRATLGKLPDDMHYAPLISPLVGGRMKPQNYHLETANVHLRTSIATWEATRH